MAVAEALLGLWQCAVIISLIKKCVIKIAVFLEFWNVHGDFCSCLIPEACHFRNSALVLKKLVTADLA